MTSWKPGARKALDARDIVRLATGLPPIVNQRQKGPSQSPALYFSLIKTIFIRVAGPIAPCIKETGPMPTCQLFRRRIIMRAKISIIITIALAIAAGLPAGASAFHSRSADRTLVDVGQNRGDSQTRINDCVHVQFPQCSDGDSTATRN
jgi:hypothetical protein